MSAVEIANGCGPCRRISGQEMHVDFAGTGSRCCRERGSKIVAALAGFADPHAGATCIDRDQDGIDIIGALGDRIDRNQIGTA